MILTRRPRSRSGRRAVFVETTDISVKSHLDGLIGYLAAQGWEITVMSDDSGLLFDCASRNRAKAVSLAMDRKPSLSRDLRSLLALTLVLYRERADLVIYGTPKASLLGAIASTAVRAPNRVHVLHGLRVETLRGWKQRTYLRLDRLVESLSTRCVAVGDSLADRALELGSTKRRPTVLGRGSAQGVDIGRFHPKRKSTPPGPQSLDGPFRITFIGRLTADKGIDDLVAAYQVVAATVPQAELLLAGAPEGLKTLTAETQATIAGDPRVHMLGAMDDVGALLRAADVLCLPTRREGLPTVLLEGGAAGVPIVATRATGVIDLIRENVTGLLVEVGAVDQLADALLSVWRHPAAAQDRAFRLRQSVVADFDNIGVWRRWHRFLSEVN